MKIIGIGPGVYIVWVGGPVLKHLKQSFFYMNISI